MVINNLLNASKYINIPIIKPIKINKRNSPLLNLKTEYSISKNVKIQKAKSSQYVSISGVLKLFLNILNISNNSPMMIPSKIKTVKI